MAQRTVRSAQAQKIYEGCAGIWRNATGPENSHPLNFETFVPNHDPSLEQPSQPAYETYGIPHVPGEHVSCDEAFNRALGAMYWTVYWTAVYHVSLTSATRKSDVFI